MFIPTNRVTIIIFCNRNLFGCVIICIQIVCYVKIRYTAENDVHEEDYEDRNDNPTVNICEDKSQADCSEDNTAKEERKEAKNVEKFSFSGWLKVVGGKLVGRDDGRQEGE